MIGEAHTASSEFEEYMEWLNSLEGNEKEFVDDLMTRCDADLGSSENNHASPLESFGGDDLEFITLPDFNKIIRRFLPREAHHYLFNVKYRNPDGDVYQVQDEIRDRFVKQLKKDAADNQGGKHIVVGHSMGTVIAYDCLKRFDDC